MSRRALSQFQLEAKAVEHLIDGGASVSGCSRFLWWRDAFSAEWEPGLGLDIEEPLQTGSVYDGMVGPVQHPRGEVREAGGLRAQAIHGSAGKRVAGCWIAWRGTRWSVEAVALDAARFRHLRAAVLNSDFVNGSLFGLAVEAQLKALDE